MKIYKSKYPIRVTTSTYLNAEFNCISLHNKQASKFISFHVTYAHAYNQLTKKKQFVEKIKVNINNWTEQYKII